MALLDVSKVTKAIVEVIRHAVASSPESEWTPQTLKVSPDPPDQISEGGLGFYLYHLSEDAHFKNQVEPAPDDVPVRLTPMGLDLYYQLTAHSSSQGNGVDTYLEQKMLGLAVKALHDFPVIDDGTEVAGQHIFTLAQLDNRATRLRISLQPMQPDEAVNYWTAGSSPHRLAVYYQVSVVLLEPEEPGPSPGRVLTYGTPTFVRRGPRLDSSQSTVSFQPPGQPTPLEVAVRPAQATVGELATFIGTNLRGDTVELRIRGSTWDEALPTSGFSWSVTGEGEKLVATIPSMVEGRQVTPGMYSAHVVVTEERTMPDGTVRSFAMKSNRIPFVVAPSVDSITGPGGGGEFHVTGGLFEHADIESVELYLGPHELEPNASPGPGEFEVTGPGELELVPPAGLTSGEELSLRIFVNGAESPPRWMTAP